MSKWMQTKVNTLSNIESDYFYEALERMGYKADFSKKSLTRGYEGDSQPVDCLVYTNNGSPLNVGLRFKETNEGTVNMEIVADWYYSNTTAEKFTEKFTIEYNTVKYTAVAAAMDFSIETVENLSDGRRKIVMSRAA